MTSNARVLAPVLMILAFAVLPSAASGQAIRTWVSGVGDDVNPCSRTAPCKTFAGAISKTAAKGEINVLDPCGCGTVTITKSIHIRGVGNTAGVLSSGTNGITVNAGAGDRVTVSGLDIFGSGTGINGVRVLGGRVRIENSDIYGFTNAGVLFAPNTANARLIIQDSRISDSGTGVGSAPNAAGGGVSIRRSSIDDNVNGVLASGVSIPAVVNVFSSSISDNSTGVLSTGAQADVRIGNNDITNNDTGLSATSGAKITTFGNNMLVGNTTRGNATNTIAPG